MWRMGGWRVFSSSACAIRPGTREIMARPSATSASSPRSPQTAAIAPSMLIGKRRLLERRVPRQRHLDGADVLRIEVVDLELVRDLQQPRHARIDGVIPMAESRRGDAIRLHELLDKIRGGRVHQHARAGHVEALVEQAPAERHVPAVVTAESQHAGGHRVAEAGTRARRLSRGQGRRRRDAVIDEADENGVDEPRDRR